MFVNSCYWIFMITCRLAIGFLWRNWRIINKHGSTRSDCILVAYFDSFPSFFLSFFCLLMSSLTRIVPGFNKDCPKINTDLCKIRSILMKHNAEINLKCRSIFEWPTRELASTLLANSIFNLINFFNAATTCLKFCQWNLCSGS